MLVTESENSLPRLEKFKKKFGVLKTLTLSQKISILALVFLLITLPIALLLVLNPIIPRIVPATSPATSPGTPTPTLITPTLLPGDINSDGVVNILDFQILSNNFATSDPDSDLNEDGIVNILDFQILSNNFGTTQI